MSGSIGGNRIPKSAVQDTVDEYVAKVLSNFPGFKSAKITGSYNSKDLDKKDFGDIDLATYIEAGDRDIKTVKKELQKYLEQSEYTVPFRSGRNQGKKAQMYGTVVTCQFPIVGFEGLSVQIDNMVVLSEKDQEYTKSFLDADAAKQGLEMGLARVILQEEDPEQVFKRMGIKKLPELEKNQEFEFVLSGSGLSLRKVTLDNFKETSREEIWRSNDWQDVVKLLKDYDLSQDFEHLLGQVTEKVHNARSKRRILGIMKSMINIGVGEKGTAKGDAKERAIQKASESLGTLEEVEEKEEKVVGLYGGGFKPPHKAHFANAAKLASGVDKLIIFIGPKVRPGVPVTAEQAKSIWNIYRNYLPVPVEIRISSTSPVGDIYKLIEDEDLKNVKFIIGKAASSEDDKKFAFFNKNREKYPNVELKTLPIIVDKEDEKFSASTLRQSVDIIKKGDWMPDCLDRDDARKVLEILLKPLQQQAVENDIKEILGKALDNIDLLKENSSGTPISFSSITSSENRAKLVRLYEVLCEEIGDPFEIQFNQSFIWITGPIDQISSLYEALYRKYSSKFRIENNRGGIEIRVLRQLPVEDPSTEYRTDANHFVNEEVKENSPQEFDWANGISQLILFMKNAGENLEPLPDIYLDKTPQSNDFLAKTGEYNPKEKSITLYISGRHPVDVGRSCAHELIHHAQQLRQKIGEIKGQKTSEDSSLEKLEAEAYEKGNMYYRQFLESLGKYE